MKNKTSFSVFITSMLMLFVSSCNKEEVKPAVLIASSAQRIEMILQTKSAIEWFESIPPTESERINSADANNKPLPIAFLKK